MRRAHGSHFPFISVCDVRHLSLTASRSSDSTEAVTWYVLPPVSISKPQVEAFAKIYKHNSRPVQPTNQREVLESR